MKQRYNTGAAAFRKESHSVAAHVIIALWKATRHPYESEMVIEDVPGRSNLEPYAAALQYQQKEHMERSVEYAKKSLDPGARWRA